VNTKLQFDFTNKSKNNFVEVYMTNNNRISKSKIVLEKSNSTNNPRIAVYIRCACYSPEAYEKQKELLIGYCKRYFRNSVVDIYEDVCSGLSCFFERDGAGEMMSKIANNEYDILLVRDISRISRNPNCLFDITEYLAEQGVSIYTPDGQFRWIFNSEGRAILI
jgi:DNA invertase Pin-like site-specific DNA recombinase